MLFRSVARCHQVSADGARGTVKQNAAKIATTASQFCRKKELVSSGWAVLRSGGASMVVNFSGIGDVKKDYAGNEAAFGKNLRLIPVRNRRRRETHRVGRLVVLKNGPQLVG